MAKIRNTYAVGDLIYFKKETAPKHIMDMAVKNPHYDFVIRDRGYSGYNINVLDSKSGKIVNTFTGISTKCFSKGSIRSIISKAIEQKQGDLKKITKQYEEEISSLTDQLKLMDELGVDKIDETDLEYARRVSVKMNVSLKEAYQAIRREE